MSKGTMRILSPILAILLMLATGCTPAAGSPAHGRERNAAGLEGVANHTLAKRFGFAQSCSRNKDESYVCYERSTSMWWLRSVCSRPDGSTRCSRFNLNTWVSFRLPNHHPLLGFSSFLPFSFLVFSSPLVRGRGGCMAI